MFSFYTPVKANNILPEIKTRFNFVLKEREKIIKLQSELNSILDEKKSLEFYFKIKIELNKAITSLYKNIEAIEELGILIKSIDEGLLDFPSKRFNEEVWLCWKVGEDQIRFWHGKDEGFLGRKPLSLKGTFNSDDLEDLR